MSIWPINNFVLIGLIFFCFTSYANDKDWQKTLTDEERSHISLSGKMTVLLPAQTKVFHHLKQNFIRLEENIYVEVYKKPDKGSYYYLVTQDKSLPPLNYSVSQEDITFIDHVTNLSITPQYFEEYEKKHFPVIFDDKLNLIGRVNVNLSRQSFDTIKQDNTGVVNENVTTFHFEGLFGSNWKFPLNLGVQLSFERGQFDNEQSNSTTLTSFDAGPYLNYKFLPQTNGHHNFYLGLQRSLLFNTSHSAGKNSYVGNTIYFKLERSKQYAWGNFQYGLSYRLKTFSSTKNTAPANSTGDRGDLKSKSIGIYIGHSWDTIL